MLIVLVHKCVLVITQEICGVFRWLDDTVRTPDTKQLIDDRFNLKYNSTVYNLLSPLVCKEKNKYIFVNVLFIFYLCKQSNLFYQQMGVR